ncbi:ELM1/GtrOC1 family putative glycosyltransferase [Hansschlegelia zhihuaiae]|uniref:ELM1/GtrOC1 family putative glycosyltransferase n=1 Tax=Hansschlegelia zhihuaiae TaxID=405005 RepID=UPI0013E8B604|nr:ELM1/GtrOC1 family putative glycosyltransferase [Hansschlegelia zhihuaiae]
MDKAGHVNQCLAVCEAAGWRADEIVRIPSPGRMTAAWDRFVLNLRKRAATRAARPERREPGRLRIVASGRAAEDVVASYRTLYGDDLFALFSGRPQWLKPIFDVALAPRHGLEAGECVKTAVIPASKTVIFRSGPPTRRLGGRSEGSRAGLAALIGGLNKAFVIDVDRIARQLDEMAARRDGEPLSLVFSRRTPQHVETRLRRIFDNRVARFVDRADRAGFEQVVASAGEFVVTPDSITMVCEMCVTGRPVHVFDLEVFDRGASTYRFLEDLLESGDVTLATGGTARSCEPGLFAVPPAALSLYEAWETGPIASPPCAPRGTALHS